MCKEVEEMVDVVEVVEVADSVEKCTCGQDDCGCEQDKCRQEETTEELDTVIKTEVDYMTPFTYSFKAESLEAAKEMFNKCIGDLHSKDVTAQYKNKAGRKELDAEMAVPNEFVSCVACTVQPIANENITKSTISKNAQHGARKWITKYSVWEMSATLKRFIPINAEPFSDRKLADAKAREITSKSKLPTIVKIMKVVSEDDVEIVSEIKYKSSKKERLGSYLFFGKK